MGKYFGTDGIRAVAGEYPLTKEFITKLGYISAKVLHKKNTTKDISNKILIGSDTRASGKEIAKYLSEGIMSAGYDVIDIGVTPTPIVSYLVKKLNLICGIVISASHNPAQFNGIKFFDNDGMKLGDKLEDKIEQEIISLKYIPDNKNKGVYSFNEDLNDEYIKYLKSMLKDDLQGLKVVLDCANGASYKIAPKIFSTLKCKVHIIGNNPNGQNINESYGALATQNMQKEVIKTSADIGIGYDGDGDRLILCDEQGKLLDGDNILSIIAMYLKDKNKLNSNKVALTVMSNYGLLNYLSKNNIQYTLTKVGDKYLSASMEKENLSIGAEPSGHIILRYISPTGDGILASLQVAIIMKKLNKSLSAFTQLWTKYPIVLKAIEVKNKIPFKKINGFDDYLNSIQQDLSSKGRILVRYSGTEPILRILAEAQSKTTAENIVGNIMKEYTKRIRRLSDEIQAQND